ncbi:ATP-binding cassette domain-containing protein [Amycolatopsis sp. CA-230715]|uniref:ATP-binding cassette domain-containing protein n=1 Tax=Amycolatopsis sp. CA-230715 TaxID=2745196 RepID=UPI001C32F251|nr:ATP-binding cassette domain-containing protein [Amycolatopsis sp. CA-230715]QWF83433.1 Daunorubicin/doxorubicin resistance ATP-binding protein DrrA [Amycolatopsis sp. CA-230715]
MSTTTSGTKTMTSRETAIEAAGLVKTYGKGEAAVHALAGLDISAERGGVFGLLGPNGAGKSTTVKILTTLSKPDSGAAVVAGVDVLRRPDEVRRVIGYVSQKPAFDPIGTGRENLVLQGRIHGMPGREARRRADELLERFGLAQAANRLAGKWSGGMQRKLDVAAGLLHRPSVLFLDEPTTGLDPEARADMWDEIARLAKDDGLTVLLTTHYLEEADNLASRLVIVDKGKVVAEGTPDELKSRIGGDTIHAELVTGGADGSLASAIGAVPGVSAVRVDGANLRATVANGAAALPGVLAALESERVELASVTVSRPSLDDVYLRHAGRAFRNADQEAIA